MILTPIADADLPAILDRFETALADHPIATGALRLIATTVPLGAKGPPSGRLYQDQVRQGVELAHAFGIQTLDEEPAVAFSWDGVCIRTRSEPSVVIHEVTHWLVCSAERRRLYDFGLGAGPETGRAAEADAVCPLDWEARQREECLASLLGILWEAELGQAAILAFLEQNWLEGHERPATRAHFIDIVQSLHAMRLVDDHGHPVGPPAPH
ncbi:MAG: hypothetical protein P4M00_03050 [Azospirillaceae bacterium]|nr:hypothetical protein [Azospirillaceae bacterium]